MKKTNPDLTLHLIAHEELQRMAREEMGRSLTEQELHTMLLQHDAATAQALDLELFMHNNA